ncbi:DUF1348 family protein [Hirschia litorea]|uniref:DUF1348 family protein n=1 Tax=Hirschia litorea TaxID=1199156 RepID=A0ABW2IPG4_9PROT
MRPPLPPFTHESATEKVRLAENGWNSQDAVKVSMAYTPNSVWRNRATFVTGREEIVSFLTHKWETEHEYRLIKELFAFHENRISVRYAYEYHNHAGNWFRAYGNENWVFDENGLMSHRYASINDLEILESDRKITFPKGARPQNYPSLSELGL